MNDPRAFFCNSGTEASEAAIKLARLYGKQHGGKWKLLTASNGFHGRTYGALSATGQTNLQKGCEPMCRDSRTFRSMISPHWRAIRRN